MKKNTIKTLLNTGALFLLSTAPAVLAESVVQESGVQDSSAVSSSRWYGDVHEITLLDGTKLTGTITAQTSRSITIATNDGATIEIPVRLIGTFDGKPYSAQSSGALRGGDGTVNRGEAMSSLPLLSEARVRGDSAAIDTNGNREIAPGASKNALMAALRSLEWEKRSAAARELGARGQWDESTINALSMLLGDAVMGSFIPQTLPVDSSSTAKLLCPGLEAAKALAAMESRGYEELAHQMNSTNPLVRQRSAFGLGETNNRLCVPILLRALKDRDSKIRATAASALHFAEAIPQLIKAINDNDAQVRSGAVTSLGRIGDPSCGNALAAALDDVNPAVRSAAAGALGKIGGTVAIKPLAKVIVDPESDVRLSVVIALAMIRDTATVPPLITGLRDRDSEVVKVAAIALGDIRDPRAIEPLRSAQQTCPESARDKVGISLKLLTEIPLLIGALDDRDTLVRRNVEYLLWLNTGKKLGYDKKAWAEWFIARNDSEGTKNPEPGIGDSTVAPVVK